MIENKTFEELIEQLKNQAAEVAFHTAAKTFFSSMKAIYVCQLNLATMEVFNVTPSKESIRACEDSINTSYKALSLVYKTLEKVDKNSPTIRESMEAVMEQISEINVTKEGLRRAKERV